VKTPIYYVAIDYDHDDYSYTVNADPDTFYADKDQALAAVDIQNDLDFRFWSEKRDKEIAHYQKQEEEYDCLVRAGLRPFKEHNRWYLNSSFKPEYFVEEADLIS